MSGRNLLALLTVLWVTSWLTDSQAEDHTTLYVAAHPQPSIEHVEITLPQGLLSGFPIVDKSITMEEAVGLGLDNNLQIQLASAETMIRQAALNRAQAKRWPTLGLGSNTFFHNQENRTFMTPEMMMTSGQSSVFQDLNVTAKTPLFTGGKIIAGIRAARSSMEGAQAGLTETSVETAYRIREAYLKVLLAESEHMVHRQHLKVQDQMLQNAQSRYKVGRGLKADILRIQTEIASAKKMLNEEHNRLNNELFELKAAIGIDLGSDLQLAEKLQYSSWTGPDLSELIQQALNNHPKIKEAQASIREAEAQLRVTRANYLPQIYGQINGSLRFRQDAPQMGNGVVGWLSASLPVFDRNRDTEVKEAQARLNKAKQELKARELEIGKVIAQAWTDMQFAKDNYELSEAAIQQAQEDFRLISQRKGVNRAIEVEVQDAALKLREANLNQVTAIYNHELAKANLKQASGEI